MRWSSCSSRPRSIHGSPPACIDQFGPPAARLLRDDPWLLLGVPGVTIADADELARAAIPGVTRDDPRRARAIVGFLLARDARDGHTVSPRTDIEAALRPFAAGEPAAAVDAAVAHGSVIPAGTDGQELLGLARYAEAEDAVAQGIARLLATGRPIEVDSESDPFDLDEAQRSAVEHALRAGVSVLTGGPGTGKSRTVAALVALAERAGPLGGTRRADRPRGQAVGGAVRHPGIDAAPAAGRPAAARAARRSASTAGSRATRLAARRGRRRRRRGVDARRRARRTRC